MRSHIENLRRLSLRDKQAYILDKLQYAPAKMQHRLWRIMARASERLHRPLPKKLRVVQQLNFLAVHNFTPRIYSGGRVSLFVATGDLTAAYDLHEGWEVLAPRGVDVHEIPGDHINIIKEPYVGTLAEKLRECLDQVAHRTKAIRVGSKIQRSRRAGGVVDHGLRQHQIAGERIEHVLPRANGVRVA